MARSVLLPFTKERKNSAVYRGIPIPASFFGMILGLAGLGNCWQAATVLWHTPGWISESILYTATVLWLVLLYFYLTKWWRAREEALAELNHPVLCCFISLVPISTMLIAQAVAPHARAIAIVLFMIGAVGQVSFSLYRSGQLWKGNRDPEMTTPVLYLPTVASNFVSAIVASNLGYRDWGALFFGAGIFSWFALESIIMHRLYIHTSLAKPLRPTLGIQLAPPVVACVAYLSLTSGTPDLFAQVLFGYGILQSFLLIRLLPWIGEQPFAPGYWAFTFGVAAITLCTLRFVERGLTGPMEWFAIPLFALANLIIGGIAIGTVLLLLKGKLLPPPLLAK